MHNSSTHNTNRKTISTNLKNGAPITLREYDRFTVRGEVAYSHFKSPLSPKQIENKNKRRDEWAKSEGNVGPYYHDDPSVPYGELVIKNADIVSRYPGQTTNAELFAMDHLFESTNHDYGIKKMNMKNHVATVSTGLYSSEGVTPCSFDDELAPGSEVICEGMIYFTKYGRPAIALTKVYSVGDPVYLDRTKYTKKHAVAA